MPYAVRDYHAIKAQNAVVNVAETRASALELRSMPRYVMIELTQGCNLCHPTFDTPCTRLTRGPGRHWFAPTSGTNSSHTTFSNRARCSGASVLRSRRKRGVVTNVGTVVRLLVQRGEHRIDVLEDLDVASLDLLARLALTGLTVRLPEPALVSRYAGHSAQQNLASVRHGELNLVACAGRASETAMASSSSTLVTDATQENPTPDPTVETVMVSLFGILNGMSTTTIKVDSATRDRLAHLARTRGTTMNALLSDVAERLETEQHWSDIEAAYERIQHEDPDAWAEYLGELAEWELSTTTTDSAAAQEWPEYNQ